MFGLLRGDDLVEDGGERLVFYDDSGRDEWGHDELPLTDVGFHGDPETTSETEKSD